MNRRGVPNELPLNLEALDATASINGIMEKVLDDIVRLADKDRDWTSLSEEVTEAVLTKLRLEEGGG